MRARTPHLVGLVAATALVLTSAPAQARATDPAVPVAGATLTVTGSGWGHGHGMSQWGAQGAALQGLAYPAILAFYYPGTRLSALGGGKVKVLITADDDNNLKVKPAAGLKLVDKGRGKSWRLPTGRARTWKLKNVGGQTRVYYKTGGWHRYRPGGHATLQGDGQFKSASHRVTVKLPSGIEEYRGAVRFVQSDTVNVVGMENYLRGVVPAEVYTSWEPAALQAQAIAARSYAAFERAANTRRYFHVYDSTRSQAYHGYDSEVASTDAAIVATAGRMLTYGGKPAFTQFSASSGGWTSTGSQPYLVAQPDPWTVASGDPNLGWKKKNVSVAPIEKARPGIGTLTSIQVMDRDGSAAPGEGWVLSVRLTGTKGSATVSGSEFKSLYGLRSAYFTLSAP
jgi:SpoIID/LytB domain protein